MKDLDNEIWLDIETDNSSNWHILLPKCPEAVEELGLLDKVFEELKDE